jgi:hypothetical protein
MSDVAKQLQAARQRLLDLTMRNRLLNFFPTKRKTIQVIDEIPREVFDILVLQERVMEFRAKPMQQQDEDDEFSHTPTLFAEVSGRTPDSADADSSQLWQLLPQATDLADHHTDRFLQTNLESEELQKRLYYIHQQARLVFEEQGYTVLYLALGFLEWRESPSALQSRRAPLLLIPVELERRKVGTAFKLHWTGEELLPNLSLQAKLSEQG